MGNNNMSQHLEKQESLLTPMPIDRKVPSLFFDADIAKRAMTEMRTFVRHELIEGVHYAKRGNAEKPSLEKPGAEVIFKGFRCRPEFDMIETEHTRDYAYYAVRCRAINIESDIEFASGLGASDTNRDAGGSKASFAWQCNAALKMAKKSAMIDAAMTLGCVSELFTQDMADAENGAFEDYPILESCPEHESVWSDGKYGPYHRLKDGGYCNQRTVLRAHFTKIAKAAGLDGKAGAVWLADHGWPSASKLKPREWAQAIEQLKSQGDAATQVPDESANGEKAPASDSPYE